MINKAKQLAKHTESLAAGPDWGVGDQDVLEWLIRQAERNEALEVTAIVKHDKIEGLKTRMAGMSELIETNNKTLALSVDYALKDAAKIEELERQVKHEADLLANCESELEQVKAKLKVSGYMEHQVSGIWEVERDSKFTCVGDGVVTYIGDVKDGVCGDE